MLSQLISGVCRVACLKRMENDSQIKGYRSEQFADGTLEDKIPENPFHNYYRREFGITYYPQMVN